MKPKPYYRTSLGRAYLGDSLELVAALPAGSVNFVWWLSKTPWPKANNRHVLKEYSRDMIRLIERGYRSKPRPSGHNITPKFRRNHGGAIPPNLLEFGNNDSNGSYLKRCGAA